jgi:hypothetical protein
MALLMVLVLLVLLLLLLLVLLALPRACPCCTAQVGWVVLVLYTSCQVRFLLRWRLLLSHKPMPPCRILWW